MSSFAAWVSDKVYSDSFVYSDSSDYTKQVHSRSIFMGQKEKSRQSEKSSESSPIIETWVDTHAPWSQGDPNAFLVGPRVPQMVPFLTQHVERKKSPSKTS